MATSTTNRKSGHYHFFVRKLIKYADIFWSMRSTQLLPFPPWTYYIGSWCLVLQRLTCWIGCLPVKVEIVFTTLLSFQRTAVMFKDTSVTTSDDSHFSLFIFAISRNGAFSIWFALAVPVASTLIVFKCLSKPELVK